jgi:hypothetical protein
VHDVLTRWGHEVVLVGTTRTKQMGIRHHGRKTDRIDAELLARAVEQGGIPVAHVLSPALASCAMSSECVERSWRHGRNTSPRSEVEAIARNRGVPIAANLGAWRENDFNFREVRDDRNAVQIKARSRCTE